MKDLIYEIVVAVQGYYWVEIPGVSLSLNPFRVNQYACKQVMIPGNLITRLKLALELYRNGRHVRQIKPWSDKEI